jgi:virginiamycin B lyase
LTGIVTGPDKNVWFTNALTNSLVRVTMAGKTTAFPLTATVGTTTSAFQPGALTIGADGRFWMGGCVSTSFGCEDLGVAAVTTSGQLTLYVAPHGDTPGPTNGLVLGPDGNVWFAGASHLERVTPTGKIARYAYPSGESNNLYAGVTVGPDKKIWFTEHDTNAVGNVDPSTGTITEINLLFTGIGACAAAGMTAGGDGNLYFACGSGPTNQIAQLSTSGNGQAFTNSNGGIANAQSLTTGRDGNVYIAANGELDYFDVGKGLLNAYPPPSAAEFISLTAATDGNIWVLDATGHVDAYVLDVLNVNPASVSSFEPGNQVTVTAYYSGTGTLKARSNHPGVARVSKRSTPNTFIITQTGFGQATITISDGLGNSFEVSYIGS